MYHSKRAIHRVRRGAKRGAIWGAELRRGGRGGWVEGGLEGGGGLDSFFHGWGWSPASSAGAAS